MPRKMRATWTTPAIASTRSGAQRSRDEMPGLGGELSRGTAAEHGHGGDRGANVAREAQRHGREGENGVQSEEPHLPERVLGLARVSRLPRIGKRPRAKSGPGHHPAEEAVPLAHRAERVGDAAP